MTQVIVYQRGQQGLVELTQACAEAGVSEGEMFGGVSDRPESAQGSLWRNAAPEATYGTALVQAMQAKENLGVYFIPPATLAETEAAEGWIEPTGEGE